MKNIILFIFIYASILGAQADSSLFSYYPLETGNYWEYELLFINWPDIQYEYSYQSNEVLGDTVMSNGLKYKIFEIRSIPDTLAPYYLFERIDSSNANVYQFNSSGLFATDEYLIDSLASLLNDSCKASRDFPTEQEYTLTICYDISKDTITGFNKNTKYFCNLSWIPGMSYGLSKDIGLTQSRIGEFWVTYQRLEYARVRGVEYGIPVKIKTVNPVIKGYEVKQNYPNPFNPITIVEYYLPHKEYIEIILFNSLGQRIRRIYSGVQNAGNHYFVIEGKNLPSGIYYYQLKTDEFQSTKKCLLLK